MKEQKQPKLTPMMQQYFSLKEKYKDYLLFFRMGDFYEMFFDDAKIAAKILDIALTRRGKDKGEDIAMCGVPFHSYEPYLEKLIKNGYRVAICDQIESAEEAKKRGYKSIVKRDVIRVVTQGTLTEDNLLNPKKANYLTAVSVKGDLCGLAWIDISTGQFYVKQVKIDKLSAILALIDPKEILFDEALLDAKEAAFLMQDYKNIIINFVSSYFHPQKNSSILKEFYNLSFLDSFGKITELEIGAAGAIISYLQTTQKDNLPRLSFPKLTSDQQFLQIDATTLKSLEIFSERQQQNSLYDFLDNCKTASGARGLRQLLAQPLLDIAKINKRLDKVEFFYNNYEITLELREILKSFPDLERATHKLLLNRGGARDFLIVINALHIIVQLQDFAMQYQDIISEDIKKIFAKSSGIKEIIAKYEVFVDNPPLLLRDGNFIKNNIYEELDYFRNIKTAAKEKISILEEKYRNDTGINNLKIKATNILGYYVEVNKNFTAQISNETFIHRQTLANATRYVTEEILAIQNDLNQASQKSTEIELNIFDELLQHLSGDIVLLNQALKAVSLLDIYSNLAFVAHNNDLTRPQLTDDKIVEISGGFHPIVKNNLPDDIAEFTVNDCKLDDKENLWLITGPNMAGKSTFLRQNALLIILGQIGSFVPAKFANIGIVDRIFSRVGASDDLSKGRSTFMVEMLETAAIMNNATERSFLILDEIGRGTATFDGMSLAFAITEYIHNNIKARTLFATHYHELSNLAGQLDHLSCYYSQVEERRGKIIFTHKVLKGVAKKSYGIAVASLAGLPAEVIDKASNIIKKLESQYHMLDDMMQLSLFDNIVNEHSSIKANQDNEQEEYIAQLEEKCAAQQKIFENLKNLDINNITAKQALDILYDYYTKIKQ